MQVEPALGTNITHTRCRYERPVEACSWPLLCTPLVVLYTAFDMKLPLEVHRVRKPGVFMQLIFFTDRKVSFPECYSSHLLSTLTVSMSD